MSLAHRQRAQRAGRWAETACVAVLRLKGYRVLARRWRAPVGEIDIVARRGRLIVFVEVKARASRRAALEAVGARQRARITRAAAWFLQGRPELAGLACRFDVFVVAKRHLPAHIQGAWEQEAYRGTQ